MILAEAAIRRKPVKQADAKKLPQVAGAIRYLAEVDLPELFGSPKEPPSGPDREADCYHLYSIERMGTLACLARIGAWDWYGEGAKRLLAAQRKDGSWSGSNGSVVSTSFALLFLCGATEQTWGMRYTVEDAPERGEPPDPESSEREGAR